MSLDKDVYNLINDEFLHTKKLQGCDLKEIVVIKKIYAELIDEININFANYLNEKKVITLEGIHSIGLFRTYKKYRRETMKEINIVIPEITISDIASILFQECEIIMLLEIFLEIMSEILTSSYFFETEFDDESYASGLFIEEYVHEIVATYFFEALQQIDVSETYIQILIQQMNVVVGRLLVESTLILLSAGYDEELYQKTQEKYLKKYEEQKQGQVYSISQQLQSPILNDAYEYLSNRFAQRLFGEVEEGVSNSIAEYCDIEVKEGEELTDQEVDSLYENKYANVTSLLEELTSDGSILAKNILDSIGEEYAHLIRDTEARKRYALPVNNIVQFPQLKE